MTATCKVCTLLEKKRSHIRPTAVVFHELARYNIDVAALSETRILGESKIKEVGSGYTFFLKGKPLGEKHFHGIGTAIRTCLLPLLNGKFANGINERLMTVDLYLEGCILTLISAYAPTLPSSDVEKEIFMTISTIALRMFPPPTNYFSLVILMQGLELTLKAGRVSWGIMV